MANGRMSRREMLRKIASSGAAAAGLLALGKGLTSVPDLFAQDTPKPEPVDVRKLIAVANAEDPKKGVADAIEALGGIAKFVRKGAIVSVKPNIGWNRKPEQAANTNPEVVAAVVEQCVKAGAKKVRVFDRPVNDARRCYAASGIQAAAEKAGAEVILVEDNREGFYEDIAFPGGVTLDSWPIVKMAMETDVLINVPVAKHHNLTKLTLGIKNLIGIMGGNRGLVHEEIADVLCDVLGKVKPHLTIMDATLVLVKNGPTGGNVADVKKVDRIIAGVDVVAVDAYTAQLECFGMKPEDIGYIKKAAERGFGEIDISKMKVVKVGC
jgi:uncharacterized protein (DUF362 family)